jgi:hypothetical protein
MRALFLAAVISVFGIETAAAQAGDDALARARQLYNERRFEAAVLAAEEGRRPERVDAVDLIIARAHLERYRESQSETDLTSARERLRRIVPQKLNDAERTEYLVGLGAQLYLEGRAGAAAQVFDTVFEAAQLLPAEGRERVLDWWASALDHEARPRADMDRQAIYLTIRDRMRRELGYNPGSAVASYWLSAAASGQGDHQGAWDAAVSGWVRAPLAPDGGMALRRDLDRLVQQLIVPLRARALASSPDSLIAEWDEFKVRWAR